MKRTLISLLISVPLLAACVFVPGGWRAHNSGDLETVPPLPPTVVLEAERFYYYSDDHYWYTNDQWYYSRSRSGPWAELPRDRLPKEVKSKWEDMDIDRVRDNDQRMMDWEHYNRVQ